jgi:hypothetical protein
MVSNQESDLVALRDVLERLPTQPNSRIDELLPHLWTPASATRHGSGGWAR